ncbi:hypothetical protein L1987_29012 [Smallanthus sonchifolius]|uniref:Uncharacterized protein n=1 Tax=Smallanthus sonchifolius TaxID=185202 RepID=A0ACB9HZD1_9ASTR|nr:hypothetical protein L1987_29012 [Smallanthus sonchifolius]
MILQKKATILEAAIDGFADEGFVGSILYAFGIPDSILPISFSSSMLKMISNGIGDEADVDGSLGEMELEMKQTWIMISSYSCTMCDECDNPCQPPPSPSPPPPSADTNCPPPPSPPCSGGNSPPSTPSVPNFPHQLPAVATVNQLRLPPIQFSRIFRSTIIIHRLLIQFPFN